MSGGLEIDATPKELRRLSDPRVVAVWKYWSNIADQVFEWDDGYENATFVDPYAVIEAKVLTDERDAARERVGVLIRELERRGIKSPREKYTIGAYEPGYC